MAYRPGISGSDQGTGGAQSLARHSSVTPCAGKACEALQLEQLEQVAQSLDQAIAASAHAGHRPAQLRHTRDKALLLLGFWRGFHGDELTRLQVQYIEVIQEKE